MIYNRDNVFKKHNIKRVRQMSKIAFKIISAILATVIICLSFTACSSTVKDAELRCPMANEPVSLDPQTADTSESLTIAANCYETLMKSDSEGKIVPAAAEKMTSSTNGLAYRFTLYNDNKWHINSNHEEIFGEGYEDAIDLRVTAHDFVFGIRRALMPDTKSPGAYRLYMIKNAEKVHKGLLPPEQLGVTAIDDFTLQIELEYASSEFMQVLTEPITAPCNREFFEATKGRYGLSAETILCNGSFYLSRWYAGNNIVLRRNEDNAHSAAKVYSLTYAFTQDEQVILDNLLDRKYAVAELTAAQAEKAKDKKCNVHEIQNTLWGLTFNCSDPIMSNPKFRLALVMSTDFNEILSSANDKPSQASGIIPPSCTIDGKSAQSILPAVKLPANDTTTAKKYFDECMQGKECSFNVLCTPEYENAIRQTIQNWQQLFGIKFSAKVEVVDADELKERVRKGNYQCAVAPISTNAETAVEFLYSFRDPSNICRYTSENFNTLLSQLLTASSANSVAQGCAAAQNYLIQNSVIIPLFFQSRYIATNPKITSVKILSSGDVVSLCETELLK